MAVLDPNVPMPDISADQPAGPNLEYDEAVLAFERLTMGKEERFDGTSVVPAEDPDWGAVVRDGWSLTERTYDLRILTPLAIARLHTKGVAAFAASLALILQLLESRWLQVHPPLSEDDEGPAERTRSLQILSEPAPVLRFLRRMPLARAARAGIVTWRDIALLNGELEPPKDQTILTKQIISGIFLDTDRADLAALRDGLASTITSAVGIQAAFQGALPSSNGPDLSALVALIRDLQRFIGAFAPEPSPEPAAADVANDTVVQSIEAELDETMTLEEAMVSVTAPSQSVAEMPAPVFARAVGPINSRADAIRILDLVIDYYHRKEPSSPVPLLLARARRLADRNFIEILRDLAPDAISQAELAVGKTPAPEES